jgi:hypothetical protein
MKYYTINSTASIRQFILDIYKRYQKPFLPEDDFSDLLDAKGQPVFSAEEAAYLDDVMLYCFVFCMDNALDLHDIADDVQASFYASKEKEAIKKLMAKKYKEKSSD